MSPAPGTIASSLAEGAARLGEAGVDSARHDAELLLAAVLGTDRLSLYVEPMRPVDGAAAARYRELIDRRTGHEPVQYILGWEEFRGLRLTVTPDVLIPRPETEGLVELTLERLTGLDHAVVADVGTGSGAIACALAAARPDLELLAVDQSLGALAVASDNVRTLGLELRSGLHTGECELVGDKPAGVAVNTGARVAAKAAPGEVLVSRTVKDLVAGSGIEFEERGTHKLKGLAGEWQLYAVSSAK